jgi:hypothetical protein
MLPPNASKRGRKINPVQGHPWFADPLSGAIDRGLGLRDIACLEILLDRCDEPTAIETAIGALTARPLVL